MDDFDKKFLLVFYSSSLIIKLQIINCDRENHVNFKYMHFSKDDAV